MQSILNTKPRHTATAVNLSDEQLRLLQINELEMLVEVDRICKKNGIRYSLDGGTLLGAIRHKGFIPWDDDADVIFTRHEYAKFFRACKEDLDRSRFFLQDYRTDSGYWWGHAKLRRKGTEYVRTGQEHMKYKTGVNIDLFVVDNVPDNRVLRELYYDINFCIRKIMYSELGKKTADSVGMRVLYQVLDCFPKDKGFKLRNALALRCNQHNTKLVSHLLLQYPKRCKYGMPAECFESYINVEFEGMVFDGFKKYDLYLRTHYGDYMQLPPKEQRHGINTASKIHLMDMTLEDIQRRYEKENKPLREKHG